MTLDSKTFSQDLTTTVRWLLLGCERFRLQNKKRNFLVVKKLKLDAATADNFINNLVQTSQCSKIRKNSDI